MAAGKKKNKVGKGKGIPYEDEDQEVSRYEKGKSFERKVGDIFILMGFEVEYNREIAGNEIDVFIKEKRKIGKKYAYYICECKDWGQKVGVDVVRDIFTLRESVNEEFKSNGMGKYCEAIIVSIKGFTEEAINYAESVGITFYTYNQLLAELMDFDTYLTVLIQNFEGSELQRLYIQQDFIPERTLEEINSFSFVEKWLKEAGRKQFSLLGDYGTGKTSFAKVLAYKMAKAYKEEYEKSRIPFLVNLRDCKGAFSLKNLLHQQLINSNVKPANEEIFLKLLTEGQILLIFDAFDEIANMSNAEIALSNLKQLNQAVSGDAKVILTSRSNYFMDNDEVDRILNLKKHGINFFFEKKNILLWEIYWEPEYEIVYLKEFSESQVREYLQKAMPDDWEAAYKKIRSTYIYNLRDVFSRPLLLDVIVKTLPKVESRTKEFNVTNLYEASTQFWFEREDQKGA
ncbi:MAG: NACHT domain-containing protein [Candidatus Aminicenantes bacterium]|nr:MAG: NACHT domain-containing protein [Candidatus Aminicenantes bacterium]